MTASGFALFDTAIGACGVVWSEHGIAGVQLPEAGERATRVRLQRRFAEAREQAPPAEVQHAIDGIVALLRGEKVDLTDINLDLGAVDAFQRRVYEVARTIQPGSTLSYGEIASRLGDPAAAR